MTMSDSICLCAMTGLALMWPAFGHKAARGASLGLLSMEERAALAGGGLEDDSHSGPGHRSPRLVPVKVGAARSFSNGSDMNTWPFYAGRKVSPSGAKGLLSRGQTLQDVTVPHDYS